MTLIELLAFECIWRTSREEIPWDDRKVREYLKTDFQMKEPMIDYIFRLFEYSEKFFNEKKQQSLDETMKKIREMRLNMFENGVESGYSLLANIFEDIDRLFAQSSVAPPTSH